MTSTRKTNRALLKRVKLTSRGKVMKRPAGHGHFNAKDSGSATRNKRGFILAPKSLTKSVKALIN